MKHMIHLIHKKTSDKCVPFVFSNKFDSTYFIRIFFVVPSVILMILMPFCGLLNLIP